VVSALTALFVAAVVSLCIGGGLYFAVRRPLDLLLAQSCPGDAAVNFWARFTLIMLLLSPLFTAVAFGLPQAAAIPKIPAADVVSRIITSALSGGFFAMVAMGAWVSSLARKYPLSPVARPDPVDRWGTK